MNDFAHLTPELMLDAVTQQGFDPTGAIFPLNSYENRVYEIAQNDAEPIIAKFYRPGRWSAEIIADEHRFVHAAAELEVPVVAPHMLRRPHAAIASLGQADTFYFAISPKFRGREEAEHNDEQLRWLGRTLARLHNLGAVHRTPHRITLQPSEYGAPHAQLIQQQPCIPETLRESVHMFLEQSLQLVEPVFAAHYETIPLHGDCHHGNVLWNHEGPHLLDFDDMLHAAPVQDVWMLFNGTAEEQRHQREQVLAGYTVFREFDVQSFRLVEPLRTLRMIRHAAWIGERYNEEAFQRAFPYYNQSRYWEEFVQAMREQVAALQELQWQ